MGTKSEPTAVYKELVPQMQKSATSAASRSTPLEARTSCCVVST